MGSHTCSYNPVGSHEGTLNVWDDSQTVHIHKRPTIHNVAETIDKIVVGKWRKEAHVQTEASKLNMKPQG